MTFYYDILLIHLVKYFIFKEFLKIPKWLKIGEEFS